MNLSIIKFLKNYSTDENRINSLIISSFISSNNLQVKNNILLKAYVIDKSSETYSYLETFNEIIRKNNIRFDLEFLIELFEFIISPEDKIINGAVYTPSTIRTFIVNNTIESLDYPSIRNAKIGDISCGCGGFLATVAEALKIKTGKKYFDIYKSNIFGLDIEVYSIERSKILLSLLALQAGEDRKTFEFNLFVGDALGFRWDQNCSDIKKNKGFDIIVGNPPYVCSRNIQDSSLKLLENWSVTKSGHPDLYIPFFQIGIELLTQKGILGYITVNTFFKSINGRALREYFSNNSLNIQIIDFGGEQVFRTRNTYTCICIIRHRAPKKFGIVYYCKAFSTSLNEINTNDYNAIHYSELDNFKGWHLNTAKIRKVLHTLENSGSSIESSYSMRTGIATLRNDIYKFTYDSKDDEYYYFIKNGVSFKVEILACRDVINSNILKNNQDIDQYREKIIFPYSLSDNKPIVFRESFFKLNFPKAYRYLSVYREELSKRDKGKKKYDQWFAYGRNQSLDITAYKLFYPHICSEVKTVLCKERTLLFYNGEAIISESIEDLIILSKVMESRIFWFYISHSSKPYSSGFFSLSKNYIKNFSLPEFSKEERDFLIKENDSKKINTFLLKKYNLSSKIFEIS